jgi:hypothetical protein
VAVNPPNLQIGHVKIRGTAPYVQNSFSQKARQMLHEKHEAGDAAKSRKKKEPKDFQALYEGAMHVSTEGWHGIPAPAFRNAMISACRIAGIVMTRAKLAVFVVADGVDRIDGTPLVKITKGEPQYVEHTVRNETGVVDIRPRPMWQAGWEATVQVRYDADMFKASDVLNLLARAGMQVGVGEGRPDSKNSCGMGWGTFELME